MSTAAECFTDGRVLCALINKHRPDLLNFEDTIDELLPEECNERAFKIFKEEFGTSTKKLRNKILFFNSMFLTV
jgi:F-actin monooxygenase